MCDPPTCSTSSQLGLYAAYDLLRHVHTYLAWKYAASSEELGHRHGFTVPTLVLAWSIRRGCRPWGCAPLNTP